MEDQFYSRATGKLKKGSYHAFGNIHQKKATSTIYTLSDDDAALDQYPTGKLSATQKRFIESFLQGVTQSDTLDIDPETRAIHWIGMWLSEDRTTIVSCTMLQPHITNSMVHLTNVMHHKVVDHAKANFPAGDYGEPSIGKPQVNPQLYGRFAIPLADSLIESGILDKAHAAFNLILLSEMQPIFIVSNEKGTYECRLTHSSCKLMSENCPPNIGIVGPTSTGQSYSFRSRDIVSGRGTGPAITIHRSGTLQYQGKPDSAYSVGRCFKQCIDAIMNSSSVVRFINSLAITENSSGGDIHMNEHGLNSDIASVP
jgi:hypothetical protein